MSSSSFSASFERGTLDRTSFKRNDKPPPSLSLDLDSSSDKRKVSRAAGSNLPSDMKLAVLWIESFEDVATAPVEELLGQTGTGAAEAKGDYFVIFIQPLKNGLLRVKLCGQITK